MSRHMRHVREVRAAVTTCAIAQALVQRQHADWAASLHTLNDAAACGGARRTASRQAQQLLWLVWRSWRARRAGSCLKAILQPLLEVRRPSAMLLRSSWHARQGPLAPGKSLQSEELIASNWAVPAHIRKACACMPWAWLM